MALKLGTPVEQVVPVIKGVVIGRRFSESHDCMEYLIESPDSDGDGIPQTRWAIEGLYQATGAPTVETLAQVAAHEDRERPKAGGKEVQTITAADVGAAAILGGQQ